MRKGIFLLCVAKHINLSCRVLPPLYTYCYSYIQHFNEFLITLVMLFF